MAAFSSSPFQQLVDSSPPPLFVANSHHHLQPDDINGGGLIYQSAEALQNNLGHAAKKNTSMDNNSSSIVTDKYYHESSEQITAPKRKSRNHASNSPNSAQSKDMRGMSKGKKQRRLKEGEDNKKLSKEDENKEGYIHVRARRGQATDSHSLAERVRRERISERMKLLQALVPGCDKVTGKALMLDEIINYVQSLQYQVEFLSMKLASVNPMFYDFGMDLESLMVRPDQNLSSPLAGLQQCSPTTPVLDNPDNSLMFQQPQIPNAFPAQGHRQMFWEMEEQRQKINNQGAGMISNTLFSFH